MKKGIQLTIALMSVLAITSCCLINMPPLAPINPEPANGETNQSLNLTLSWDCEDPDGDYPLTYDVYFGKSANNMNKISTRQIEKSIERSNLDYFTKYYWEVIPYDSKGKKIDMNDVKTWNFTTKENSNPNKPYNPEPDNYATNQKLDITLSWECTDPDGDSLTYDIYFGTSSNPSLKKSGHTSKSYSPGTLSYDTIYYWKIVAKDANGGEKEGPLWRFTTKEEPNYDPDTPDNPNPSNYAQDVSTSPTLSWECSDQDGDNLTYDIYFGTSSSPPLKKTGHTNKSYSPGTLSYNTTYYWKLKAKDGKGGETTGPIWKFTTKELPEGMTLIEGGTFQMGDTLGDGGNDEKPVHEVTLTYSFYMGKYEVTFEEYDEYCEDTGKSKPYDEGWGRGQHPVINVSWWDAIEYCNWLSKQEGLAKAYDDKGNLLDKWGNETTDITKVEGYRLPTEAEWEYAASGGNQSNDYKYSGSDDPDEVAWYDDNSGDHTHEVGTKKPNELGIYDMSGNVWEWCQDRYDRNYYEKSPKNNPYNHKTGSYRVVRGGSWIDIKYYLRVTDRHDHYPIYTNNDGGFRIYRTLY